MHCIGVVIFFTTFFYLCLCQLSFITPISWDTFVGTHCLDITHYTNLLFIYPSRPVRISEALSKRAPNLCTPCITHAILCMDTVHPSQRVDPQSTMINKNKPCQEFQPPRPSNSVCAPH
ncbi:hypothetical protein BDV27DRAFT_3486 [Aspergillus caelatus]|uniref:Secreted protein n=1 Tax=Aspergillus caelatus TaxID=61420 RepID=A0A5N7A371_9EURO|nr:uncharacterized protein BDV27DRAFT_3486 [Aspergillus caelatus]KAE8363878.1 hypothetical protein BDV27DRAFT_3486 [Aspergillus caelatus]